MLLFFGLLLLMLSDETFALNKNTANACSSQYNEQVDEQVCEQEHYYTYETEICVDVFQLFQCRKKKNNYRTVCRIVTTTETKTRWDCCDGYSKVANQCLPFCEQGCEHGACVRPGECECSAGYSGNDCSSSCDGDFWGPACVNPCLCENSATCEPKTGECICGAGYIGDTCGESCGPWQHGIDCGRQCTCVQNNTQTCDHQTGECECFSGYKDPICATRCPPELTGAGCTDFCPCQNSGICLVNNEGCQCTAGWKGDVCADECSERMYGPGCIEECPNCFNGGVCNRFSGKCECPAGFIGEHCETQCEPQTWGLGCDETCDCEFNQQCDSVDGTCLCNIYQSGDRCETLECPEMKYSPECNRDCRCENNGSCNMLTGECTCISVGYTGEICAEQCDYGKFGIDCQETCECSIDVPFCYFMSGCITYDTALIMFADSQIATTPESEKSSESPAYSQTTIIIVSSCIGLCVIPVCIIGFIVMQRRKGVIKNPPGYPERNGFINPAFNGSAAEPVVHMTTSSEEVEFEWAPGAQPVQQPYSPPEPEYGLNEAGQKVPLSKKNHRKVPLSPNERDGSHIYEHVDDNHTYADPNVYNSPYEGLEENNEANNYENDNFLDGDDGEGAVGGGIDTLPRNSCVDNDYALPIEASENTK